VHIHIFTDGWTTERHNGYSPVYKMCGGMNGHKQKVVPQKLHWYYQPAALIIESAQNHLCYLLTLNYGTASLNGK